MPSDPTQRFEVDLKLYVDGTSQDDAEQSVYDNLLSPPFEVASLSIREMRT